jgi:hypothetical protein
MAYNQAMMLKPAIHARCVGVPSSRKIAQARIGDVARDRNPPKRSLPAGPDNLVFLQDLNTE